MSRRTDDSGKDLATLTALLGLMLFAGLLLALVAFVLPQILGVVIVVLGFGSLFVLHYVCWGHWLSQLPPPDDLTDD